MRKIIIGVIAAAVLLFTFKYCDSRKDDKIVLQESSDLIQEQIKTLENW